MLNPIELIKMQNEAKKMQNKMRERKIKGDSKNGLIRLYMNGAQELEDIFIDEQYLEEGMLDEIRKGFKEAFKDYQKKMQKEMVQDVDLDQLKSMFK